MLDRDRSLALALEMVNRLEPPYYFSSYEPQCCWANAVKAMRIYAKQLLNAVYVEGWCAMPDIHMVQPHGWIELEDGTIIDPTYVYSNYEQGIEVSYEYFPALRYKLEALKGIRITRLPIVDKTHGWNGRNSEEYQAAMVNAYLRIGVDIRQDNKDMARIPS